MPRADRVVSNTSPLLNLALIDRLDLIERQFSTVDVPEQVWAELMVGEAGVDELKRCRGRDGFGIVAVDEDDLFREFRRDLDHGEAAALTHAIHVEADLCLLDEREARAAAKRHDLARTGVIGLLLRAAHAGNADLQSELDSLRRAGFWISDDLYARVLDRAPANVDS